MSSAQSTGSSTVLENKPSFNSYKTAKAAQPFLTGGFSACFATACIHPIDLAKVRLQLFATLNPGIPKPQVWQVISSTVKKDGISAAYAGLSASQLRAAVYGTSRLGLYGTFREAAAEYDNIPYALKTIGCAMSAGALATVLGTPFDVALVRMQADSMKPPELRRNYKHVIDAVSRIYREEGPRKLYLGLSPNILRAMAMNTGQLAVNDVAKTFIMKYITKDANVKKPSTTTELLAAAVAGVCAGTFALPFDMIKSRLQDQRPGLDGKMPYNGLFDCAKKIFVREGPLAYWTGYTAFLGRVTPHAMIVLLTQAKLNTFYVEQLEKMK